jgi:CheY-like chemotaxis protein
MVDEQLTIRPDHAVVEVLGSLIETSFGYAVVTATSGERAIELLSQFRDQIYVMLIDIVMHGGMSGIELTQYVTVHHPYPVGMIVFTGFLAHKATTDLLGTIPVLSKDCGVPTLKQFIDREFANTVTKRASLHTESNKS